MTYEHGKLTAAKFKIKLAFINLMAEVIAINNEYRLFPRVPTSSIHELPNTNTACYSEALYTTN